MKERWKGKGVLIHQFTPINVKPGTQDGRGWVRGAHRAIWDFHLIVPRSAALSRPHGCGVNISICKYQIVLCDKRGEIAWQILLSPVDPTQGVVEVETENWPLVNF